jgi:hypothetical protein
LVLSTCRDVSLDRQVSQKFRNVRPAR